MIVPWFYRTRDPSETDVRLHRDTSLARHSEPQSPLVIPNHRVVRNLDFWRGETASLNEKTRLAVTTHQSLRGLKARSNLVVETASQARLRARSDTLLLGQKARLLRRRNDELAVTPYFVTARSEATKRSRISTRWGEGRLLRWAKKRSSQ